MQIYLITNKINGKQYIGQTSCTVEKRWQEHVYTARGDKSKYLTSPLYLAIRKYGPESFCLAILDIAESREELNQKEIEYIAAYNTMEKAFGYNRHEGGSVPSPTPEGRIKAGLAIKGRPFSEEHRRKISEAHMGKKLLPEHVAKMRGRVLSEETRKKMSDAGGWRKGLKSSPEHVEKIRIANTGKKHSEETKRKISMVKTNPSEETRRKLRESHLGYKMTPEAIEKRKITNFLKTVAWG